jgi:hypothetical protein
MGLKRILNRIKVRFAKRKEINAFGHKLIINNIPKRIYHNKKLLDSVDILFNSELVLTMGGDTTEQRGKAYSTCKFGNDVLLKLDGIDILLKYISNIILREHNITNGMYREVVFNRAWANKIFKNCSGVCHVHNGPNDGTAIFYFSVPDDGSNLIVLKHPIDGVVKECHKDISKYIKVETGDLVIHKQDVPHAVSEHMSDLPRICFVFDYSLF